MKKTSVVLNLFLTIIFVFAKPLQAEETNKMHQEASLLKNVDSNKDGKASKAEFIAALDRKFRSMDVDKSQVVSVQEFKVYGEKDEEARKKAHQAAQQAARVDKLISKKKFTKLFTNRAEREFAVLDKNHDNKLDASEVGASKAKKKNAALKYPTVNGMSKAEFVAVFTHSAERNFVKLDKNRDGALAENELGAKPKSVTQAKVKSLLPTPPALFSAPPVAVLSPPKLFLPAPVPTLVIPSLKPQTMAKKSPQKKIVKSSANKKALQQKLIKSFFTGIDANNDGQISQQEKTVVFERLFNRLDTNHDQLITQEEINAGRHLPLSAQN